MSSKRPMARLIAVTTSALLIATVSAHVAAATSSESSGDSAVPGQSIDRDHVLLFANEAERGAADLNGDEVTSDHVAHRLHIHEHLSSGIVDPSPREANPLIAVSVGGWQTCGIRTDESIGCSEALDPPTGTYTAVAVGSMHSCAISTDGTIDCWGENILGSTEPPAGQFTALSAGDAHSCAIATTGQIECWGRHFEGQTTPPPGSFTSVSAGMDHTCAIGDDSTLACWGHDASGQSSPPAGTFVAVGAGMFHTCAINTDLEVECWGDDTEGQLDPPAGSFTAVTSGAWHSCAIRADETIQCWGNNFAGQTTPYTAQYAYLSAGENSNCGITTDALLLCWGDTGFLNEVPWLYDDGVEVTLTAIPEPGFQHVGWNGDGCEDAGGPVCVVTMDQDRAIGVVFDFSGPPTLPDCDEQPFSDVPLDHPFCPEIAWMADNEISTGFPDGTYRPSIAVTRQAMSAFMARLAGTTDLPDCTSPPFSDVAIDHPFCPEISWMADTGISTGFPDGTYRPSIAVTRQAMSAFMARLAGATDLPDCTSQPFSDVPIDHPFCPEISWMADNAISTGFPDGTYRPSISVTRQAMSAFMYRVFWLLP